MSFSLFDVQIPLSTHLFLSFSLYFIFTSWYIVIYWLYYMCPSCVYCSSRTVCQVKHILLGCFDSWIQLCVKSWSLINHTQQSITLIFNHVLSLFENQHILTCSLPGPGECVLSFWQGCNAKQVWKHNKHTLAEPSTILDWTRMKYCRTIWLT